MITKTCTKCQKVQPIANYFPRGENRNLSRSHCKDCLKVRSRIYSKENNVSLRIKASALRHRNTGRTMLWMARNRAQKQSLKFELTIQDIEIPDSCPILGIELSKKPKPMQHSSPSLIRIDPHKGYLKSNVQVVSYRAALIKNNATFDEIKNLYLWLESVQEV